MGQRNGDPKPVRNRAVRMVPAISPPAPSPSPFMDFFDLRHLLPLIVIGGSFTFAGSVLYGAWLLGRYRGREEGGPAALADVEYRLQRLEDVVGRVTDSLDRLEAAHRLTARLITDKASDSRPPHRQATPH